jgi:hypothetical protein
MRLRVAIVLLLVIAAFFAAGPWIGCVAPPLSGAPLGTMFNTVLVRACTYTDTGTPFTIRGNAGLPGFTGPYWGSLLVGIAYLVAAVFVARTKRAL